MLNGFEIFLILFFSIALMWGGILLQMKWYNISLRCKWLWSFLLVIAIIGIGIFCSYIMFFVENGFWGGRSLFGFIFFSPILYFPIAKILRIKYLDFIDISSWCVCFVLALSKILCMIDGCCLGKILYLNQDGIYVKFPSREVEMIIFFVLAALLFALSRIKALRGNIFPIFLISYGVPRLVLSFWREERLPFAWGLPAGAFWSVWAIAIGIAWIVFLAVLKNRQKRRAI